MAGDWIKMRMGLRTHPKVVRMSSALQADRFRVIGALHAVWCLADEHTEDGDLPGYSLSALDDSIGWPGFSAAMRDVEWLIEGAQGLVLPRFDEHNGASAKRRAMEAERKRRGRKESASDADKKRTREEKRRDISTKDVPEGFEAFWTFFPKRAGGNPKARAVAAYRARLGEGHHPDEILAGARRYAAFIKATGKEGTEFVKQAATFLGTEKSFLEPWEPPREAKESPLYRREGVM
jgi:hypothetical protein